MTFKEFIEAAIEGGYETPLPKIIETVIGEMESPRTMEIKFMNLYMMHRYFPIIALDPEAWKAVGKVKGWSGEGQKDHILEQSDAYSESYAHLCMQTMVKALWNGQTLEEYIATL